MGRTHWSGAGALLLMKEVISDSLHNL